VRSFTVGVGDSGFSWGRHGAQPLTLIFMLSLPKNIVPFNWMDRTLVDRIAAATGVASHSGCSCELCPDLPNDAPSIPLIVGDNKDLGLKVRH
jgi:hypothetical protein